MCLGLSKWVREKALHYATFSDLNQSLACFIAERKEYEAANPRQASPIPVHLYIVLALIVTFAGIVVRDLLR